MRSLEIDAKESRKKRKAISDIVKEVLRDMIEDVSDKKASRRRFLSDDEEELALDYGSEGSDLSDTLEEEIQRVQGEQVIVSMDMLDDQVWGIGGNGAEMCRDDAEGDEADNGAKFLQQIDKDYLCSPRMIVRGVYSGEVLKLIVRRKTEGTYVDWSMFNMETRQQVLLVHGEMAYPYGLSPAALSTKSGQKVMGGWKWRGWGYGYTNLFPPPDPRVLHVDIEESVFFDEEVFHSYHLSGRKCRNVGKDENISCKEEGCGLRIWSIVFTTYTTIEEEVEYYQPRSFRKEREEQSVYLSLVAFFNGETKIALHRHALLKRSYEEVAWLTKDGNADYNDSVAAVDRSKLGKAQQIWETRVPKTVNEGDTLTAKVTKSNLLWFSFFVCFLLPCIGCMCCSHLHCYYDNDW